ncbi:dihydrofolate reductase family protein [Phycicoccus flavus]|uniref:dihydrofolate reductase family protein n=1 Tax=Phycicoccus flavus TaxID=2502783 RepID=UPI000FEB6E93|nr:dihydrofolate reductase family protein [Phycicoccus flavus]NHA66724.1 dihydrofolate reductase [Phycicoccus flavus]
MRTLALTQNTTLDARAEMLGGWFAAQGQNRAVVVENRRQREESDALLVGRRTFEDLRGYWRDLADDATGVSDHLNGVAKFVVSSTMDEPDWAGTTVLRGDVLEEVRALKAADGADIVCTGSVTLSHALLEAGLVDELRLFTYPVVQGAGRPLFPDGWSLEDAALVEARDLDGVLLQRWQPASGG